MRQDWAVVPAWKSTLWRVYPDAATRSASAPSSAHTKSLPRASRHTGVSPTPAEETTRPSTPRSSVKPYVVIAAVASDAERASMLAPSSGRTRWRTSVRKLVQSAVAALAVDAPRSTVPARTTTVVRAVRRRFWMGAMSKPLALRAESGVGSWPRDGPLARQVATLPAGLDEAAEPRRGAGGSALSGSSGRPSRWSTGGRRCRSGARRPASSCCRGGVDLDQPHRVGRAVEGLEEGDDLCSRTSRCRCGQAAWPTWPDTTITTFGYTLTRLSKRYARRGGAVAAVAAADRAVALEVGVRVDDDVVVGVSL